MVLKWDSANQFILTEVALLRYNKTENSSVLAAGQDCLIYNAIHLNLLRMYMVLATAYINNNLNNADKP